MYVPDSTRCMFALIKDHKQQIVNHERAVHMSLCKCSNTFGYELHRSKDTVLM